MGITLMATALGVLVPILKDASHTGTNFGRLIMAAGSLAELAPLVLLSVMFFSASSKNPAADLGLLAGFVAFTVVVVVVTQRVRGCGSLCGGGASAGEHKLPAEDPVGHHLRPGLLGGGRTLRAGHRSWGHSWRGSSCAEPTRRPASPSRSSRASWKRSASGTLIPVFFVSTGAGLDIASLFRSTRALILVPVFLVALLVVRGVPAPPYVAGGRAYSRP